MCSKSPLAKCPANPIDMCFKVYRKVVAALALVDAMLTASCSGTLAPITSAPNQPITPTIGSAIVPAAQMTPSSLPFTSVPIKPMPPTGVFATPTNVATATSGAHLKLDLDTIFPPGNGRDLVLDNCTTCHTFLRIVSGQRTAEQWGYVRRDMRSKVSYLSDADIDELFSYLEANFNDTKPVPSLPDWFLATGSW